MAHQFCAGERPLGIAAGGVKPFPAVTARDSGLHRASNRWWPSAAARWSNQGGEVVASLTIVTP